MKIGIISIEIGNVASVKNMLLQIGFQPDLLAFPPPISTFFDWIILPGVGSYDNGIAKLKDSGWFSWLKENHELEKNKKSSILGICLGMQLLCDGSEEGTSAGLGLVPGFFKRFDFSNLSENNLKIPHMGWNNVFFDETRIAWAEKFNKIDPRFYFVHSYYYSHNSGQFIIGKSDYGLTFGSAIKHNNIIGLQFHPEKSHKFGKLLLSEILICQN
ncbi:MAG: imidazole glycerol phosphate synthase subunit HisH [Bacteroidales bacterium]|jgi:glutamine amidotransferase|nr:imidazole glycerol phosphate synthase subunit HisH [Bacteroidales bacterium]